MARVNVKVISDSYPGMSLTWRLTLDLARLRSRWKLRRVRHSRREAESQIQLPTMMTPCQTRIITICYDESAERVNIIYDPRNETIRKAPFLS